MPSSGGKNVCTQYVLESAGNMFIKKAIFTTTLTLWTAMITSIDDLRPKSLTKQQWEPKKVALRRVQEGSVGVLFALVLAAGCAMVSGIPDLDTHDGQVYARRCGACHGTSYARGHGIPDPRFRTMAEWEKVLPRMEKFIHDGGLLPLTEYEREAIIRYLRQHAQS
jgi:mono/diheme cytochrome c family protein